MAWSPALPLYTPRAGPQSTAPTEQLPGPHDAQTQTIPILSMPQWTARPRRPSRTKRIPASTGWESSRVCGHARPVDNGTCMRRRARAPAETTMGACWLRTVPGHATAKTHSFRKVHGHNQPHCMAPSTRRSTHSDASISGPHPRGWHGSCPWADTQTEAYLIS